jgi:TolB-like protein
VRLSGDKKEIKMKRYAAFGFLLACSVALYALPAVAIIDFDSRDYCSVQNAAIMTDLFRNELIRSGRADIVDRRNMGRIIDELKFQISDWADPVRIKRLGQMIGADYLITGNFDQLGSTIYLVAQMVDIETSRAIYSSRMALANWDEYDRKVKGFAGDFIAKMPVGEIFTGVWSANIGYGNTYDTYAITFAGNNRCSLKVTGMVEGQEISQETQGTYSFDGNIFKLNALFRNPQIAHVANVQWTSIAGFNDGNTAFNILIPSGTNSREQVRITFTKN